MLIWVIIFYLQWGASLIINISCETHGIMYCYALYSADPYKQEYPMSSKSGESKIRIRRKVN